MHPEVEALGLDSEEARHAFAQWFDGVEAMRAKLDNMEESNLSSTSANLNIMCE